DLSRRYRLVGEVDVELMPTEYARPAYATYFVGNQLGLSLVTSEHITRETLQEIEDGCQRIIAFLGLSCETLGSPPLLLQQRVLFDDARAVQRVGEPHIRVLLTRPPRIEFLPST